MSQRPDIDIIENPAPDERSAQEQDAADAVWKILGFTPKGFYVIDNGAAAREHRIMAVYLWMSWIQKKRFTKAKQRAAVEAVRAIVGPQGKVLVELVPQDVIEQALREAHEHK